MNFRQYLTSLALGSAGVALFYTWLGHTASKEPIWGIAIAVSLPLILWLLIKGSLKNERQIPQEISDKLSTMHEIVRTKQFFKLKALFTDQAAIELYHSIKSVEETIDSFYKNLGMALEIKTDFKILDFKEEAQYTLKIDYKETIKFEDKTITYEYIELINFQKNDLLITYIKCINKK